MKKDLRNIVDKLVWSADSVCFNNSKDHLCFDLCSDDSRADVVSFNLQQDDFQHVNEFVPQAELLQAVQPHFSQVDIQAHTICLKFDKVSDILRELKQLGASNHNLGASRGLTTRNQLRTMTAAYESLRDEQGMLPVSYQIYTISANKCAA